MATKEEVAAFIAAEFPQTKCVVCEVGNGGATLTLSSGSGARIASNGTNYYIQGGIQSHTQQLAAQGNSQAALPCDSHKERIEKLERIVNRLLWMAGILTGAVALLGFLVNTGIELVKLKLSLH